jgi:large subunit ribosomal protein L35
MPKIKTHKGAKKRFGITGGGKVKRHKACSGHLFTSKSAKRKRNLRKSVTAHKTDGKRIKKLLPYG